MVKVRALRDSLSILGDFRSQEDAAASPPERFNHFFTFSLRSGAPQALPVGGLVLIFVVDWHDCMHLKNKEGGGAGTEWKERTARGRVGRKRTLGSKIFSPRGENRRVDIHVKRV